MKGTCTDHNNYNRDSGRVSMSTDWVDMLGILDFLEFDGRFLWFEDWHHSKKGRNQGCLCSWTLQMGKNSYWVVWISGFHTFWFIGWLVLWYLISCVMQIKWHRFLPKQFIGSVHQFIKTVHQFIYTFHKSPGHGIRSYTSIQPSIGAQFHTSSIFLKFPVRYLECMEQASGKQLWIHDHNKCRRTISTSTDWVGVPWFPGFGR